MDTTDSFGYWVRRRRKALDLTQEALAQRVGCAVVTLRKIETDTRRPSPQMAERLARCLDLSPVEYLGFIAAALRERATARLPLSTEPVGYRRGNLPAPVTSLVGRTTELTAMMSYMQRPEVRLLTLTGPAGVGKTRLAVEVGRRLCTHFDDGVYLLALAAVHDPALVPVATASTLELRETRDWNPVQSVAGFLATKKILLIFDNFEHVLPAAPFLSTLLAACPDLHVLVTSRARLHLHGEHEYVVTPLRLPASHEPAAVANAPAVRLFCERAQAARADFQLTPALVPTVVEICRRLDGLPLAIELAAARLKLFSPQELQRRLEGRLPLLTQNTVDLSPRAQGLENAIAWSFGLLTPEQRTLLAQLAVFVGGFSLEAAEAVCAGHRRPPDSLSGGITGAEYSHVAAGIDALLDHSLVQREAPRSDRLDAVPGSCKACPRRPLLGTVESESRFVMLETIREFALAQLEARGELTAMQQQHARYMASWAEEAAAQLYGSQQALWLERLETEAGNLRAALTWTLAAGEVELAARLACALGEFWQRHGYYGEGRQWLQQVVAQIAQTPVSDGLRAWTLHTAAVLAYRQGDHTQVQRWLAESQTLFCVLGDLAGQARILFDLGWMAADHTDWDAALHLNQASLALARRTNDPCAMYRALTNLGWAELCRGERAAGERFQEAYTLATSIGHTKGVAVSLVNLGWIAVQRGETTASMALAREGLRLCHLLGEREVLAESLEILALGAVTQGHMRRAMQLRGGAEALWETLHVAPPPTQTLIAALAPAGLVLTRQPPEGTLATAWQTGRAMRMNALVAFALGCGRTASAPRTSMPRDAQSMRD